MAVMIAAGAIGALGSLSSASKAKKAAAAAAQRQREVANDLRFTPIRTRSLIGDFTTEGDSSTFNPTGSTAAGINNLADFFGNVTGQLRTFDEGDASAKTLELLRQRRASLFDPTLSRLESRLLQQGRLGVGTGATNSNPELTGFFNSEAMADLEAQLAANNEARLQRQSLLASAEGSRASLFEAAMPSQFVNAQNIVLSKNLAAANIAIGAAATEMKGQQQAAQQEASFWGGIMQGVTGSLFPQKKTG